MILMMRKLKEEREHRAVAVREEIAVMKITRSNMRLKRDVSLSKPCTNLVGVRRRWSGEDCVLYILKGGAVRWKLMCTQEVPEEFYVYT